MARVYEIVSPFTVGVVQANPNIDLPVTVLHIPPALSPRKAVQVSIVKDYREQQGNA